MANISDNITEKIGYANAYEIRLEVLRMAVNQANRTWMDQVDAARAAADHGGKPYELPEDNRIRQALKTAKKLYAFVEGEESEG